MFGLFVENKDPLAFFAGDFFLIGGNDFLFSAGKGLSATDTSALRDKPSLDRSNDIFKHMLILFYKSAHSAVSRWLL